MKKAVRAHYLKWFDAIGQDTMGYLDSPQCATGTVVGDSRGGLRGMETAMLKPGLKMRERERKKERPYSTVKGQKNAVTYD